MSFLNQACAIAVLLAGCGGGGGDDSSSSVGFPLVSVEGITYTTNITIGGSQKFDVVLDTGSTTLAVAGSTCSNCGVTPAYSPGSSAADQHSTSSALYGDQSMWQAENFSDTVEITGDSSLTMRFASITSQTGFFRQGVPSEGILGMGGEAIASPGTDAYIAERTKSSLGDNFAVQLCVGDGTLWFGAPDKTREASAEAYTPLVQIASEPSYYAVNVASATIGSGSIGISGDAIVDTGTSIMVLSSAAVSSLISAVMGSPSYAAAFGSQTLSGDASSIDCLTSTMTAAQIDAALPPFTITLPDTGTGSFTLSLPATQSYFIPVEGQFCFGVASVDGLPTILGDAFLHGVVAIFDIDKSQIGFAAQTGCAASSAVRASDHPGGHLPWMIRGHQL
ncbi:MAG TPA: pepsin-like aspartic protease [Kofleriaceae bacterium]|nr:pepsin-like aspartic protease [Kofleriaceae bacterium]